MRLLKLRKSRWLRRLAAALVILLVAVAAACAYLRIRSWQDVVGYLEMSRGFHPVWKDLALGRISLGDSSDALVARHPPPMAIEYGPYAEYEYEVGPPGYISFSSLSVAAKDGRLIGAWAGSCTWSHTFFEDADQSTEMYAARSAAFEEERVRVTIGDEVGK